MPRRDEFNAELDDQVEDLRERMRLLQGDRKAHVASMEIKKESNKTLIRKLKSENKDLMKQSSAIRHKQKMGGKADDDVQEVNHLTRNLEKLRKQFDTVANKIKAQDLMLESLKDEVKDLDLESRRPNLEDSPQTRKIRVLENRLDKAMIKYNETQSIRKTYEQIVKRLREERVGFDNQLAAIERTLAAKNHDYEELILLASDANHAKEMTQQELDRVRGSYEEERRARDKELKEKAQVMKVKMEMQARLDKRESTKQDIINNEASSLKDSEENAMRVSVAMNKVMEGQEKKEHRTKIDIFENAFRKIKEATGVSDVNEVIQKLFNQEGTTENLMSVTRENQSRIEALQAERDLLKATVEELKYSGSGGGQRRKMVDDHEENLTIATAKLERVKLKYERLAKILISVKAGVTHLSDKVEAVQEGTQTMQISDENIVDALHQTEQTLVQLLTIAKSSSTGAGMAAAGNRATNTTRNNAGSTSSPTKPNNFNAAVTGGTTDLMEFSDSAVTNTRPYNQRIPLPGEGHGLDDDFDTLTGGGTAAEEMDEALSREKVKKAASQILSAQDKKMKRLHKKKAAAHHHGSEETSGDKSPVHHHH